MNTIPPTLLDGLTRVVFEGRWAKLVLYYRIPLAFAMMVGMVAAACVLIYCYVYSYNLMAVLADVGSLAMVQPLTTQTPQAATPYTGGMLVKMLSPRVPHGT